MPLWALRDPSGTFIGLTHIDTSSNGDSDANSIVESFVVSDATANAGDEWSYINPYTKLC